MSKVGIIHTNSSEMMETRFKAMIDASPILCAIYDEDFNIVEVNKAAATLFGLEDKDIYINRFMELCPEYQPNGKPTVEMFHYWLRKSFASGSETFDWMHKTFDDEPIPCEVHLEKINFGNKDVLVAYVRDVREQTKLKAMQAEDYLKLQATLDSSPLVCALFDRNHNALSVSKKAETLFEIQDRNIYLKDMTVFMPEFQPDGSRSVEKSLKTLMEGFEDGYLKYEWMYQTFDGKPLPCEEIIERVTFDDEDYILVYTRDLREEKEMLAKLQQAVDHSHRANQAKTKFLARMSHEIRTPMNSVMGIAELELQKDTHPAETEEAFSRIYTSSSMLLSIINDILDLSKVEAGKMEIIPASYETASMIIDTVQLNLMYIGSKRIDFKLLVDENLPTYLLGDEIRVKQIINNILSNAFKYTMEGSVTLEFEVETNIESESDDVILVIRVTDTGQGMTEEQVKNLSSEFTRYNLKENYAVEGTGLGLNITYQLVNMMNGVISVISAPEQGSIFTIRLPQKSGSSHVIGKDTALGMQNLKDTQTSLRRMSKIECEPMPYGRVLVVDDVESNLYVAKGFLLPYKIAIETVESGILAIEKVKSGEVYDIIFMDHMMPDLDGVETTAILREMGYNEPIVALTANAFSDMAEMFMSNGFSGYASKPIDVTQLDKYLLKFIRDKQPLEVIEKARKAKQRIIKTPDKELSEILISSFLKDAKKAMGIMMEYNEIAEFIIQAHAMKSALYNIGRKEISDTARVLEQAGRRQDDDTISSVLPKFLGKLNDIINELEVKDSYSDLVVELEEDRILLKEKMDFVIGALDAFDIEDAKEALNELKGCKFNKKTKFKLDELFDNLLSGGFDEAIALATELKIMY